MYRAPTAKAGWVVRRGWLLIVAASLPHRAWPLVIAASLARRAWPLLLVVAASLPRRAPQPNQGTR